MVRVARLIRNFMIEKVKQRRINNVSASKYRKVYDYITCPERFRKIEEKIQIKSKLDELQKNEEEYDRRKWKERSKAFQNWFDVEIAKYVNLE